jgi:SecD/SecF fusion protein
VASKRPHLILLALIIGTLAAVGLFAAPQSPLFKKPTLGLDLKGGTEVVLQAKPEGGRKVTPDDMTRSVNVMRTRVDKLGVAEPEIRTQGSDQIVIELPGVHDTQKALSVIGKTAQLQIFDLETSLYPPSVGTRYDPKPMDLYPLLKAVQPLAQKRGASSYYLFNAKQKPVVGPEFTKTELLRSLKRLGRAQKASDTILAVPNKLEVVSCDLATSRSCPGLAREPKPNETFYFLFKLPPAMTGKDLNAGGIRADYIGSNGGPAVQLQFTGQGNKAFQRITRAEYMRGQTYGVQHNAIVLDNQLITYPYIDPQNSSLSDGIDASINGALIDNIGSIGEAKDIALVLQTGALPVRFVPLESTQVSATLGQDSLNQALRAAIIGLALVAVFLLVLYRFLGLVAVIGLGIYAAFLYGVILLFNVTLTLPGFAGMILTIGVAADANVVVFERIKEEARAGRSVKAAVSTGYQRGLHTILDANVVTAITAAVLFLVATAGVKGFALMLLLGTGISLVTAVFGTRAMLGLLSGFKWFDNPSFMGAKGAQRGRWLQIDFMRRRYLWFAISGVVILVSAVALATRGLNLGIDFEGGTQITFKTPQPTQLAPLRQLVISSTGERSAVVQGRGASVGGSESYKSFQVRVRSLSRPQQNTLMRKLEDRFHVTDTGQKNVSASFGRQIARSALLAIAFSFLLIVFYIWLRFDFKFAAPVILAVLHDIVITVGVYALTGREVTTATVAAVLTVLGYSIYDTIIIFDRIRENVPLMRQAPFARIVNVSLWETIRRSLATTFITLLPVGALFFAGGDTLKDFAFALLIGITSGAYSSIFVAAPLLTLWKEREPEYARRLAVPSYGPVLEESVGAMEVEPAQVPFIAATEPGPMLAVDRQTAAAKRERRRQRRRNRPHGRPR